MKNRCAQNAMACVGAVIGAGFASGREVVTFFTRYSQHSWWLIIISAAASVGFCALIMRASSVCGGGWHALHGDCNAVTKTAARVCVTVLVTVVSGAMLSASGHMVELLWASDWAYPVGIVGTLALSWRLGFGSLKPLSIMSWALTCALLLAMVLLMRARPESLAVSTQASGTALGLARAALRAIAYAGMNITIAIGVVCGCSGGSRRGMCRTSVMFGFTLLSLLFVSNQLYILYPEMNAEPFPLVRLLSAFGRAGYIGGAALLYLALFTTLIALMRAMRDAVHAYVPHKTARALVTLALPLAMSFVGFAQIVENVYAPVGYMCILLVLAPLAHAKKKLAKTS